MDKLLYVSMTGARENLAAQQVHANNLANVTTTGFKADLEQARAMRVLGEGFESRVYAMSERPATDTTPSTLIQTGRELDVAVDGEGWIAVMSPDGQEAYTRGGELQIDAAGQLVTGSGLPVMGSGNTPVVIPPAAKVDIANDGAISIIALGDSAAELAQIDQIKLVNPEQPLFKGADGLMRGDNGGPLPADETVQLRSGYLETSNVNPVAEMTEVISLSRQFELQVNMMKTAEENSSAATEILSLS